MNAPETDSRRWQRLKDVFNQAAELAPEECGAFLSALKLEEKTFAEELAELIAAEQESAEFLQKPLEVNFDSPAAQLLVGAEIGHYKIVREIERGGMGAVFEAARQDGEFEQRVAIKLTNYNFLSAELVKRFKKERQILAKFAHPNIVRLLDGGVTPNGIPYFVMEYVEGVPINRYVKENDLETNEKLNLFLQICSAAAFAHQQLIVHRDLKPSNILVTKDGEVKLLDFGIAKILDAEAGEQTNTVNAPLTPAYASPEQIKGEAISTLSDIYSLGIVLYELLTGKNPLEIYQTSEFELPRAICEKEPRPPSAVLSAECGMRSAESKNNSHPTNGKSTNSIKKKTTPHTAFRTPHSLKGDLDNIVLKAIQKEKERRYSSVEHFAEDIKLYLQGLPVRAHPRSFAYRAGKFIRRNHWTVSLAAVAVLLITAGFVAAVWQSVEARKQQQIAEQRFNQVRKIANSLIFDYHDEIVALEGSTKLREKLVIDAVNYLDAVSGEKNDNSELQKELAIAYRKIGDVQGMPYDSNLGKLDDALQNYRKSISLLEKASAENQSDASLKEELIKSYKQLSQVQLRLVDVSSAKSNLEKAAAVGDELMRLDENNLERKLLVFRVKTVLGDCENGLANRVKIYQKVLAEVLSLYEANPKNSGVITLLKAVHGRTRNALVWLAKEIKETNPAAAQSLNEKALEHSFQALYFDKLSAEPSGKENTYSLIVSYRNIAYCLTKLDQPDEAEKYVARIEPLILNLRKGDPENKEAILTEVDYYNLKQTILVQRGQYDSALKNIKAGLELAEDFHHKNKTNAEAMEWVGVFSQQAETLLRKQGRASEADFYLKIFQKYEREYSQIFNKQWALLVD